MEIKTGYLYHIKDEFFDIFKNEPLMQNHELGKSRPTYFTIKDKDILWFILLSSKIDKYQKVINKKQQKYGFCNTILIRKILGVKHAILIQNAFPTLEKYISHVHTENGIPVKVNNALKEEVLFNFKRMLEMKQNGINLFFADIDKMKQELQKELVVN